jgi:hypothetical protein
MMRKSRDLLHDDRGQGETVTWTLAQFPLWLLVAILVAVTTLGLRRASAVLVTHNAGLAAGRVDVAAGESLAEHLLGIWWGDTARVWVTESGPYRSVQAQLDAEWDTAAGRILGPLSIRSSTWQRKEAFYGGPPAEGGFE